MLKRVKRKPESSCCQRCFANRVRYISNQEHSHHKLKKVVLPAVNFGCRGQSPQDFIKPTQEAHDLGRIRIENSKGGGNPTEDLFFELVYSAPKGVRTTAEERAAIDKIITAPFRNCSIRRGWHLAAWDLKKKPKKWKPNDDSHYLISARDRFGKATISERFGHGKEMLESWLRRMDEEICDMLNRSREVQYEPVHVIHRRRLGEKLGVKLTKLYELIAHHTSEPVTRDNLVAVIEAIQQPSPKEPGKMEQVARVTNTDRSVEDDRVVWVLFHNREKTRKFRIKKLLLNIAETQLDIELARPDGNDGHQGGAGGESSGGTGGLGGVVSAHPGAVDPESASPTSALPVPLQPTPVAPTVVPPTVVPPTVVPPTVVPPEPTKPEPPKNQSAAQPSLANTGPLQPAPEAALTKPAPAAPTLVLPNTAIPVRDSAEPAKPKVAPATQQSQPVHSAQKSEPVRPDRNRKKPQWRPRLPRRQPKGPSAPEMK
jgi:hypothetical protein